ncbi:MAG TPA: hydroxymethylbilane synthase [Burkholderiaceae bacterium]|nr:hydroxymethylbilane synthase [Burkholderiaceae bacterium]
MKLIIATRESPLALWQAEHVRERLAQLVPGAMIELLGMTTRGDRILDRPLANVGGKGLFIKELETAMLEGRAHLAVHSLKDVPMALEPEFHLAAVLEREDPRDAFVPSAGANVASLDDLPAGARVGTSSRRRELLLRAFYPKLTVLPVRGNVGTRLRKLDAGEFDALIMASAGLKRLGLAQRIRSVLPTARFLPAPGQGALGIEVLARDDGTARVLAGLEHAATRATTSAERAVSRGLGGSCEVPLAAYAEVEGGTLRLRALVGNHLTGQYVEAEARGPIADGESIAANVVARLRAQDALALLAQ